MDNINDQVLDFFYQFDPSQGLSIHLNDGPICEKS